MNDTQKALISCLILLLALPLMAQEADETAQLALIEGYIADGMLQQAIAKMEQFLEQHAASPNREWIIYKLGEVQFRLDNFANAAERFEEFLTTYTASPDAPQARYLLASAYQFQDRFAEAKTLLNGMLREGDLTDEMRLAVLRRRASVHLMLGEQESARRDLEDVLDIQDIEEERIRLAHLYYEMGRLSDARRQYEMLLERGVEDQEQKRIILGRQAMVMYQQEDYLDVVEFLQPLIGQYRDDEVMIGALAWSHYRLGQFEQAYNLYSGRELPRQTVFENKLAAARQLMLISEYHAAINQLSALEEEYHETGLRVEALSSLVEAYTAVSDYHQACQTLEKLAPMVSNDAQAFELYKQAGDIYLHTLENYDKAAAAYLRALSIDEDMPGADEVKASLISVYLSRGDRASAQNRILDFIDKHEDSPYFEEILFKAGELYEKSGAFDLALEQYRKIAQLRGKSPFRKDAYLAAIELVSRLQRWRETVSIGIEFSDQFPEDENLLPVLAKIADAHYSLGEFQEGIDAFEKMLTLEGSEEQTSQLLNSIAWGYYKLGDFQQSALYYQRVFDEYSNSPEYEQALYWLGWLAAVNNDLQTANQRFENLLKSFPGSSFAETALFQLAANKERQGETESAVDLLEQLVGRYPEGDYAPQARNKLVELAVSLGDYQAAVTALPQFDEQNPVKYAAPENLFAHGNERAEAGDLKGALEAFMQMKERFPNSVLADETAFNAGSIHYQMGNYRLAVRELNDLLEQHPDTDKETAAHYLLGQSLMKLRRFEDAAYHFQIVLSVNDDQQSLEMLNYLLGVCFEQAGAVEEAVEHYKQYLVHLGDPSAMLPRRLEIATLLMRQGESLAAVKELQRIISNTSDDRMEMNAQYLIGQAFEDYGDYERAAAEYLKVTYAHNSAPAGALMARMKAGRLYEKMERPGAARAIYEGIIRNHAGSRFAQVAKIRLDALGEPEEESTSEAESEPPAGQ